VRRIWASLLLSVFNFALIAPALLSGIAAPNLPACCRKNGAHRCALSQAQPDSSGPALQAARCPLFGATHPMAPAAAAGMPKPAPAIFAAIVSHPTPQPQTGALGRLSIRLSGLKRGPPSIS